MPRRIPPRFKPLLSLVPVWNRKGLTWEEKNGEVVLIHAKELGRMERALMSVVGGSEVLRRPLGKMGSAVWRLCDGRHTVADICADLKERFGAEAEPVLKRVAAYLKMLAERNYITMMRKRVVEEPPESGEQQPSPDAGPLD